METVSAIRQATSRGWWLQAASRRSKKSTASTRWAWMLLSGWPYIQAGSRPERNTIPAIY
jgi:hypothetical protein